MDATTVKTEMKPEILGEEFDKKEIQEEILDCNKTPVVMNSIELSPKAYSKQVADMMTDYKCAECGNKYQFEELLNIHMTIHNMIKKPYKCTFCTNFECTRKKKFIKHIVSHITKRLKELKHERFMCRICNLQCPNKYKLLIHLRVHTNESPFKCNECDKAFKSKTSLRIHSQIHLGTKNQNICDDCGGNFSTQSYLRKHINRCHNKETVKIKCTTKNCNVTFSNRHAFDKHKREKHPSKLFECDVCKKIFFNQSTRRKHVKKVHGNGINPLNTCRFCNKPPFSSIFRLRHHYLTAHFKANHDEITEWVRKKRFPCKLCNKTPHSYVRISMLRKHFEKHLEKTLFCEICNSGPYSYPEFNDHKKATHENVTCEICNQSLIGHKTLEQHVRYRHSKKIIEYNRFIALKNLNCQFCHTKIESVKLLKIHLKSTHNVGSNNVKSYIPKDLQTSSFNFDCKFCKRKFPTKRSFADHITATHGGKAYECAICDKKIYTKNGLLKHARGSACKFKISTHTSDEIPKTITCDICNQSNFSSLRALKIHIISIHSTIIHKHECKICKTECVSRVDFLKHILNVHFETYVHLKQHYHECRICKRHFDDAKNLVQHVVEEHSQVSVFQCGVCHKVFFTYRDYFTHSRYSHKKAYHECRVCNKKFNSRRSVALHTVKIHPGVNPYVCKFCNEEFFYQREYLRHEQDKHNGSKTYRCNICLGDHMNSKHLRYNCKICGEKFSVNRNLWKHLSTHSLEDSKRNILKNHDNSTEGFIDMDNTGEINHGFQVKVEPLRLSLALESDEACESEIKLNSLESMVIVNTEEYPIKTEIKVEPLTHADTSVTGFIEEYELEMGLNTAASDNKTLFRMSEIKVEDYIDTPGKDTVKPCKSEVGCRILESTVFKDEEH